MGNIAPRKPRELAAAKADSNPEGKGANGFLLDWYRSEPRSVVAKPQRQIVAEFFTGMLVLSAQFKYKPVVGVPNYLYLVNGEWRLSLIAPHEWSRERRASFIGECMLQRDMTWTIAPSDLLADHNEVSEAVGRFYDAFSETMDTELALEDILPFYAGKLPYYQRLYASALSRSIRAAVVIGGQESSSCREWRAALPKLENALLTCQR